MLTVQDTVTLNISVKLYQNRPIDEGTKSMANVFSSNLDFDSYMLESKSI